MKVKVGRFLVPTQTLKMMSTFWDGVSWYVLVYNIFIHSGVNGFFGDLLFQEMLLLFLKHPYVMLSQVIMLRGSQTPVDTWMSKVSSRKALGPFPASLGS